MSFAEQMDLALRLSRAADAEELLLRCKPRGLGLGLRIWKILGLEFIEGTLPKDSNPVGEATKP